jgi:hypothetical protein
MRYVKTALLYLTTFYLGGLAASSWTVAFHWAAPLTWPYNIVRFWYAVIAQLPPI